MQKMMISESKLAMNVLLAVCLSVVDVLKLLNTLTMANKGYVIIVGLRNKSKGRIETMTNTKAQEKTINQIRTEYIIHTRDSRSIWVSFGEEDNRIEVEIDSKGKIVSVMVFPQPKGGEKCQ